MKESLKAVVLKQIPVTDNSSVVWLYTKEKGRISCLTSNLRSKNSYIKPSLLMPLTLINVVLGSNNKTSLYRLSEASPIVPIHSIINNPLKRTVAIFLSEVLQNTLCESHPDESVFKFVEKSIVFLELSDNCPAEFHLVFLWKLCKFIGIAPKNNYSNNDIYFNIANGCFGLFDLNEHFSDRRNAKVGDSLEILNNPLLMNKEQSYYLSKILNLTYADISKPVVPTNVRRELLQLTTSYFEFHLNGMKKFNSLEILHEVFC